MHLYLSESSTLPGIQATAEAERAYWLSREKAAVKAPAEIDVHAFHDTLVRYARACGVNFKIQQV